MKYSIIKDDTPKNTVKRIQKILESLKIETKEEYFIDKNSPFAPVSLRLHHSKYYFIGTNGKGTCVENARASAYSEFMERLQNRVLFSASKPEDYFGADTTPLFETDTFDLHNEALNKYFKDKVKLLFKIYSQYTDYNTVISLTPFYSVKNNKVYNLPANIINILQGTNGMAAGNSKEEAIVQGISEICERYAMKEILTKNLSLPDVPKDIYMKYDNIKNMCEYFSKTGHNVYIKDASLGGKVPVICTVVENKKTGMLNLEFGSQPSLPIAIERTLTEYAQGLVLTDSDYAKNLPYFSKTKFKYSSGKDIFYSKTHISCYFENNEYLQNQFFNAKPNFEFSEKAFVKEDSQYTNKELLNFLTKKIFQISDDIFIRDVSFLEFPSVQIFIPHMSEISDFTEDELYNILYQEKWLKYVKNKTNDDFYNIDNLLKFAESYTFMNVLNGQSNSIPIVIPFEYLAFLCSLVKKDENRIIKYIDIMLDQNKYEKTYDKEQITLFSVIKAYFELKAKHNHKEILQELEKTYKTEDIESALDCINEVSFEMILNNAFKKSTKKAFTKRITRRIFKANQSNIQNPQKLEALFSTL